MAASATLFFLPLGNRALWNSDEGRYAEIAREMLVLKDWVSPHLNYVLYFEKPPLMYWLTAASFAVFGQTEFAARFWCAAFGVLTVGVRRKLGLPSLFDMRYSNPIDLHAVAMEFPRVNFVIPHFGAGYLRETLMLCDLCPNVYLDTSSSNSWVRYLPERLDLKDVFRKALEVAGPQRLLFGSDSSFFPRGWNAQIFQTQIQALRDIEIPEDHARLILGGNLERLLARCAIA